MSDMLRTQSAYITDNGVSYQYGYIRDPSPDLNYGDYVRVNDWTGEIALRTSPHDTLPWVVTDGQREYWRSDEDVSGWREVNLWKPWRHPLHLPATNTPLDPARLAAIYDAADDH